MLSQLFIENIAVISQATINFKTGLNIFTGETGAGKTILINAINAVLGGRTSRDLIRSGEYKAFVSATFTGISQDIIEQIEELGYKASNGEFLITREMDLDGKGNCKVNGRPATLTILREITSKLITIHGQHDNMDLLNADKHINYLDSFAQLRDEIKEYNSYFQKLNSVKHQLDTLKLDESEKIRRIDNLTYTVKEISDAQLIEDEDIKLEEQQLIFRNAEKINKSIRHISCILSGDEENQEGIISLIEDLLSEINSATKYVSDFNEYEGPVKDITYILQDLEDKSRNYLDEFDYNPIKQNEIESRIALISRLKKKYDTDITGLLNLVESAQTELNQLESSDELIQELEAEYQDLLKIVSERANILTEKRKEASDLFVNRIKNELTDLNMSGVNLQLCFDKKEFSSNGQDKVEIMVSANPGEPPRPLAKIASGGEISRIMLSIQNVLADRDSKETMIYDEIDTGVSGQTAQKIGSKLYNVSKNHQIIVVTHLAQVAAFANQHLKIYKTVNDDRTFTNVDELDKQSRIMEIARIMVGDNITDSVIQSAQELIDQCQ